MFAPPSKKNLNSIHARVKFIQISCPWRLVLKLKFPFWEEKDIYKNPQHMTFTNKPRSLEPGISAACLPYESLSPQTTGSLSSFSSLHILSFWMASFSDSIQTEGMTHKTDPSVVTFLFPMGLPPHHLFSERVYLDRNPHLLPWLCVHPTTPSAYAE